MISQHIECEPRNDNYAKLARYIADADHEGEKCLLTWCAGTWAGDDEYDLSITEVVDTQAMNTRTTREKTYHLLVSFRPEDEAKLTPEVLKALEVRFAQTLGFEEHQRHCGVHKNTNNLHLHVAYNMIHPERLSRHEPYRDYPARDKLCRELEQEYGLTVDNGRDVSGHDGLSTGAAKIEAMTGEQSFESYAKSKAALLVSALETAKSWQDVHTAFAQYGMAVRPKGAGLIVANLHGKEQIKASSIARELSAKKLIDLVGQFVPPAENIQPGEERYSRKPVHKNPERDNLYAAYQTVHAARKEALETLKNAREEEIMATKEVWQTKRAGLSGAASKRLAANQERSELLTIRQKYDEQRAKVIAGSPATWIAYLQEQAGNGNETALAILRSKKTVVQPERVATPFRGVDWEQEKQFLEQEEKILTSGMTDKAKKQLLSVIKMQRIVPDVEYDISTAGVVMFTLPDGGRIRDTGQHIYFGTAAATIEAAEKYAKVRWGRNQVMNGNEFRFVKQDRRELEKEVER